MNKKTFIIILVLLMVFSPIMELKPKAEDIENAISLSIEEAIDYALNNSQDIILQRLELEKAKIAFEQDIKTIEKIEDQEYYTIPPITFILTPDNDVNERLAKNGTFQKEINLNLQIAEWNLRLKENQIKYNTKKAYFDLLEAHKELEIADENLQLTQRQYKDGKLMYDLGSASQQQLLGLEIGLSQAQSLYDSAKVNYDIQLMSFQSTIGLPFNQKVILTDDIDFNEQPPIYLEEGIRLALENNTNIKIAQRRYELAEAKFKAIRSRFQENSYRYKEYEVLLQQAAKNVEATKNTVEMDIRGAYLRLATAIKQIDTCKMYIDQANETVKVAQISFGLGKNTTTEVIQANLNLMNAKKSMSQHIHAYNMALLDYEYSIGIGEGM